MTMKIDARPGQPDVGAPEPKVRPRARWNWGILSPRRISAVYLWALFLVVFGLLQPSYLTVSTFQVVFSQGAVTAVLALAFLVPLTADTFDLSIGEMMSLTIVLMNWFAMNTHINVVLVALMMMALCGAIGFVSGFIVVKLRVNSLIATLGMSQVLAGMGLYVSQNKELTGAFSNNVLRFGNATLWRIPVLDVYMVAIAAALWFILEQTPVGRRMFAVGGNYDAARLAGLRSPRVVWGTLVASGVIAAVAGIMYTLQVGSYTTDVGQGYLFPALAAVFFGASQLSQRPNVWGTLIAYFALGFGIYGLTLQFGEGAFWVSPLFQGLALIGAVALASYRGAVGGSRDGRWLRRFRRGPTPAAPTPNPGASAALEGSGPA